MEVLADKPSTSGNNPQRFEAETISAASTVQEALGLLLAELPSKVKKPSELQRALNIDYKICWHVLNVVQADDPLEAAKFTPSALGLKRFLASSLQVGIGQDRVQAVQSAIDQFSEVVHRHAADRTAFQAMVASASKDPAAASEIPHRRAVYRGMSHIWGVQVESHQSINFVRRSASGDRIDCCSISVKRGFHRLHSDGSPIVYGQWAKNQQGLTNQFIHHPLDQEAAKKYQAPLLPQFSSPKLPELRTETGDEGWVYIKLAEEGIGRQSRVDLAFGLANIGLPVAFDKDGRRIFHSSMSAQTPTALFIHDLLVHRPSFGETKPEIVIFQAMGKTEASVEISPRLRVYEELERFGNNHLSAETADCPDFIRMLQFAADEMRWNLAEFDLFRLRVEYPVLSSSVRVQFNF